MKLKWHLFWSAYHSQNMGYYARRNTTGFFTHMLKWHTHCERYIELGGDSRDVYGEDLHGK